MTQAQINCFTTVAEYRSFSEAAKRLFISQPAVSRQVAQLESELGFSLFDRSQRRIDLTPAGAVMNELFTRFSSDYRAAFARARELSGRKQSTVSIGWLEGWDMSLFYGQMIDYFAIRHPEITLELEGYSFADMMPAMKRGKADLLISLGSSLRDYPELETAELTTTGGIILFSREHPLASKPDLVWEDFNGETFFSINEPEGKRNTSGYTKQECLRHGFEPEILNVPSVSNAFLKMQSNNGVFFVDDWLAIKSSPLLQYIEVDSVFDIAVGWLPTAEETTKLVANELVRFFQSKFRRKNR